MKGLTSILRLGHRPGRDRRMTTHVGLTARAFGANKMFLPSGDNKIKETIDDVTKRFGGKFEVELIDSWKEKMAEWGGDIVHLSMYGEEIDKFDEVNNLEDPLIVVGAEKVPNAVYEMADHNIAVGNQPHSEVAALAVFMDRMNERVIPSLNGGELSIKPMKKGKSVISRSKVPDAAECYRFLEERGMDEELKEHTFSVLQRALEIGKGTDANLRLIIAGALLHDVGRTVTHGVEHGIKGGRLIREEGWSDELANIVERHIGGGITKEEAKEQGLPPKEYVPKTIEEKIICHADNTAGGEERFKDLLKRTEEAGFIEGAQRMEELADEFGERL